MGPLADPGSLVHQLTKKEPLSGALFYVYQIPSASSAVAGISGSGVLNHFS